MIGFKQVKLYVPVLLFKVNVGIGGAGLILKVFVTWQLNVSKTVKVPIPAGKPHAFKEFEVSEPGAGFQTTFGVTDAEPAVVTLTQAIVLVHPACVNDITAVGAGVIVTVITFVIGAHEPGGFIVKATVPDWLVIKVVFVVFGTDKLPGTVIAVDVHVYGPNPGGAVIVAPEAPHVGKVIFEVPAGKPVPFPIMVIG